MSVVEREQVEVLTEREERARILEGAALEIEVRGWHQGDYWSHDGRVCMRGAVIYSSGREDDILNDLWGSGVMPFGAWNDMPERTAAEVTFLLRWRAEEVRDGR